MSDLTETKKEGKWKNLHLSWKSFLIYGLIWFVLSGISSGIWKTGKFLIKETARIRQLIEWNEIINRNHPFNEDKNHFFPFDRKKKNHNRRQLKSWIEKNLPNTESAQVKAASLAFLETAEMLRCGELIGVRDSFAELTSRLQPELDRDTWESFLDQLGGEIISQLPSEPEPDRIAELLELCGNQFRMKTNERCEMNLIDNERFPPPNTEPKESAGSKPEDPNTAPPAEPKKMPVQCQGGMCRR